jgi:hypothetical protein
MIGRLLCKLGHHAWSERLDDIPERSVFYRLDCTRSGCAAQPVDGAAARRIRDQMPQAYRRLGGRVPQ